MSNGTGAGGGNALQRTAEVASELVIPGGANIIKGDLVSGGAHFVLAIVAKAVFGLPGLLLVHANSVAKARTGQHLYDLLGSAQSPSGNAAPRDNEGAL